MSNRRVTATMYRRNKPGRDTLDDRSAPYDVVWVRHYSYFDTAMPRAVQLAMTYGQSGDVVEFHSSEFGFLLGKLHVEAGRRQRMEMSELAEASPSLMKLMQES